MIYLSKNSLIFKLNVVELNQLKGKRIKKVKELK